MRRLVSFLFLTVTVALAPRPAAATPLLDPTFGGDGMVTAFPNGGVATAVGVDDHGRLTAVGYTIERHPDVVVARFLRDGTPDTSFSGDGMARVDLGGADYAFDAAFTPRGGIAIAGRRTAKEDRIFVLRLKADGSRLRTFSADGQVLVDAGTRAQSASAVAFTPQGRLVLGGYISSGIQARSLLVRLSGTGTLDRSFSGNGIAIYDLGRGTEQINDVRVLPGGAIVAAGAVENGQVPRFAIMRARSDGRLDRDFGRDHGYTLLDVARGPDWANALMLAASGDYLLAGSSHGNWAIAAFTPNGTPDRTYGNDGRRVLSGDPTFEQATDIVPTGAKAFVVGTVHGSTDDLGVALLRASGRLDTSFSGDGRFRLDTNRTRDAGGAAIVQANGKLVVAGQTWRSGEPRFLLVRLRTA
jgi:uncharacterized delta-60 repeat protein